MSFTLVTTMPCVFSSTTTPNSAHRTTVEERRYLGV